MSHSKVSEKAPTRGDNDLYGMRKFILHDGMTTSF